MDSIAPHVRQNNRRWALIISVSILSIGFIVLIALGYLFNWSWTGLNEFVGPNVRQYQPTKSLWDWMQLLIIPIVLAGTVFLFNLAMKRSELAIEQQRYDREQMIAEDNQREELLQGYLDRMADLLLDKGLRSSKRKAEVRDIARARTLTVLPRLDSNRKGSLIKFIYESGLMYDDKVGSIIDLSEADLSEANLEGVNLSGANLTKANFKNAMLNGARLSSANLTGVDLSGAELIGAKLIETNLTESNLSNANLTGATLINANLYQARLIEINLHSVNLNGANLSGVDLRYSDMSMATVKRANIQEANLSGILLDQADFEGVVFNAEQIDQIKQKNPQWFDSKG